MSVFDSLYGDVDVLYLLSNGKFCFGTLSCALPNDGPSAKYGVEKLEGIRGRLEAYLKA